MDYILTHPQFRKSAVLLANKLYDLTNRKIFVRNYPLDSAPVIRWGNYENVFEKDTNLNSPDLFSKARRIKLANYLGDSCIHYYRNKVPDKFPIVVRKLINSSKGRGIVICKTEEEYKPYKDFYWAYWYNFSLELAVHLFEGKSVKVFKKVWFHEVDVPEFGIKNSDKGIHFKNVEKNNFPRLTSVIEKFYSVIPIQFCRLDVGWDEESKIYRIIECNTAPDLSQNQETLNLYSNYLAERIEKI